MVREDGGVLYDKRMMMKRYLTRFVNIYIYLLLEYNHCVHLPTR